MKMKTRQASLRCRSSASALLLLLVQHCSLAAAQQTTTPPACPITGPVFNYTGGPGALPNIPSSGNAVINLDGSSSYQFVSEQKVARGQVICVIGQGGNLLAAPGVRHFVLEAGGWLHLENLNIDGSSWSGGGVSTATAAYGDRKLTTSNVIFQRCPNSAIHVTTGVTAHLTDTTFSGNLGQQNGAGTSYSFNDPLTNVPSVGCSTQPAAAELQQCNSVLATLRSDQQLRGLLQQPRWPSGPPGSSNSGLQEMEHALVSRITTPGVHHAQLNGRSSTRAGNINKFSLPGIKPAAAPSLNEAVQNVMKDHPGTTVISTKRVLLKTTPVVDVLVRATDSSRAPPPCMALGGLRVLHALRDTTWETAAMLDPRQPRRVVFRPSPVTLKVDFAAGPDALPDDQRRPYMLDVHTQLHGCQDPHINGLRQPEERLSAYLHAWMRATWLQTRRAISPDAAAEPTQVVELEAFNSPAMDVCRLLEFRSITIGKGGALHVLFMHKEAVTLLTQAGGIKLHDSQLGQLQITVAQPASKSHLVLLTLSPKYSAEHFRQPAAGRQLLADLTTACQDSYTSVFGRITEYKDSIAVDTQRTWDEAAAATTGSPMAKVMAAAAATAAAPGAAAYGLDLQLASTTCTDSNGTALAALSPEACRGMNTIGVACQDARSAALLLLSALSSRMPDSIASLEPHCGLGITGGQPMVVNGGQGQYARGCGYVVALCQLLFPPKPTKDRKITSVAYRLPNMASPTDRAEVIDAIRKMAPPLAQKTAQAPVHDSVSGFMDDLFAGEATAMAAAAAEAAAASAGGAWTGRPSNARAQRRVPAQQSSTAGAAAATVAAADAAAASSAAGRSRRKDHQTREAEADQDSLSGKHDTASAIQVDR